jgi:hypothetical protein
MLKFFTGLSPVALIGLAIAAAGILSFVFMAFHWKHQAADRKDQLATVCQATRSAANNPKLDCKQVPQQIQFMGEAIQALHGELAKQNAAIDALGAKSEADQAAADRAILSASKRARGPEATSASLMASSRAGERQAKPCEPSKALEGAWR